jgi:electron transfer flavoprotein alpha subunit
MSKILILAEHLNGQLNPATARCVNCARELKPDAIDVLVLSDAPEPVATAAAKLEGVSKVLTVARAENAHALAAVVAPQVAAAANSSYSHLLFPSTTFGKDVAPRVAASLGVGQISDIMSVTDAHTFTRPIYAGNAIITVEAPADAIVVGTVRTASWPAAGESTSPAPVEAASIEATVPSHTRFIELKQASSERPDLQSAPRVVSGGRGLGSKENFDIIYKLADKLRAAAGASRAAVDAGYCPNDMQVGQTGKIIAPELYIAIGISGAIQHLTGIKDAGTIVAINKDPDCPIFEVADIGLVGDLFKIVPELEAAVCRRRCVPARLDCKRETPLSRAGRDCGRNRYVVVRMVRRAVATWPRLVRVRHATCCARYRAGSHHLLVRCSTASAGVARAAPRTWCPAITTGTVWHHGDYAVRQVRAGQRRTVRWTRRDVVSTRDSGAATSRDTDPRNPFIDRGGRDHWRR